MKPAEPSQGESPAPQVAVDSFTFLELHDRTPGLSGQERMAVFYCLPEVLQRHAWAHLAKRMEWRAQRDFEDWCGDDR